MLAGHDDVALAERVDTSRTGSARRWNHSALRMVKIVWVDA